MDGILSHRPSPLDKGMGELGYEVVGELPGIGWNLLDEDVSLPVAVLSAEVMGRNLEWMQRFAQTYGVHLAPHGKTTMAPALFARQIAAGAWGITLATAQQCLVAKQHGVQRVLMANQLVGKRNCAVISGMLRDPAFSFFCLVDSAAGVEYLGRFFSASGQCIDVLIELGIPGGRGGVRDDAQLDQVVAAIRHWPTAVRLPGVEVYEGILNEESSIRSYLRRSVAVAQRLAAEGMIRRTPAILSGAGSAWYDVVAEEFAAAELGMEVEVVLRPGCYLTHDVGIYQSAQARIMERNNVARSQGPSLEPALQVWAYVQSRPEADLAIIGLGKRDAAFDAGLPTPKRFHRPGRPGPVPVPVGWSLVRMMDQHAFLRLPVGDDLAVGDMIAFDISHPCLTCDRWRHLLVVDERNQVVEVIPTFF